MCLYIACVLCIKRLLKLSPAYVDVTDLTSQLLMERLPLFHNQPAVEDTPTDGALPLPSPRGDRASLSPSSTPSSLAPRLTNQIAGEGAMAYLLDCYDRALQESRSSLKVQQNFFFEFSFSHENAG